MSQLQIFTSCPRDPVYFSPVEQSTADGSILDTKRTRPRLWVAQELGLLLVILLLSSLLAAYGYHDANPDRGPRNLFLNPDNLVTGIANPMSYYAIMAVGMTAVIVSGGIDISVGSIMALSGLITCWALTQCEAHHLPTLIVWPLSLLLPLAIGLLCGLLNGSLVVGLRMHPFIVTLGTLAIYRCLCNVLPLGLKTLQVPDLYKAEGAITALLQQAYFQTPNKSGRLVGGVQVWPLVFMLVTTVTGWILLSLTIWGREIYAVGGNELAARFSGISVGAVKLRVYALSGLCAGLAGLVSLGKFGTISTNTATGYELTVVAAAVVGGASLTGGRGTALGALLGALILALIENAINILHLNQEYKTGIVGTAIILAVALDNLSTLLRSRKARTR
jgi:ribose/xylose/arabinose/galactoside ABC-type transport system permease subunit